MKKLFGFLPILLLLGCTVVDTRAGNTINNPEIDVSRIRKQGEACSYYPLYILGPFGDNSVVKAADKAWIQRVVYYDHVGKIYPFFSKVCNRAYGY
ncbi:MAG: hypothetical protein J6039_01690 [Alphaproteobacteria bacterium]|nr:hypothetical protein [Alphaproteobacteria bacterium]